MSQEKIDKNAGDRREAADFLYSEAADLIESLQKFAEKLGNDSDGEKDKLKQEAERLASLAQAKLGFGNTAPSEEVLEEVRVLIESAKRYVDRL